VGEWEAHLKIEIRDEFDDQAAFAVVDLRWSGDQTGRTTLVMEDDGKLDFRIGPYWAPNLTFTITDVRLAGFTYQPGLNEDPGSLFVEGPD
jgi:hypothetical protein